MTISSQFYPLSYGQQALWFLHQMSKESAAYNFVFAARVLTPVDLPALRRAVHLLVERHQTLGTSYGFQAGRPVAKPSGSAAVLLEEIDLSGLDAEESDRRLMEEAYRPFDLAHGPVVRCSVLSLPGGHRTLLLAAHHIAIDYSSLLIVLNDLGALYQAEVTGERINLPPAIDYNQYVEWQQQLLGGVEGARLWKYWSRQLAGVLPVLDLPFARRRPALQTYRGASYTLKLRRSMTASLQALSQLHGVTLTTTLLSAFQVLLHRYTGLDDVLIGCPMAGRRPEFDRLVGFLVNPVAVRADLSGDPSFVEMLGRTNQTMAEAVEHQDYPFALLVERLQPTRDPGRSPVFQTLFASYSLEDQDVVLLTCTESGVRLKLGELLLELTALEYPASIVDLSMIMVQAGGSVTAYLQYNTELFEARGIQQMAEHFEMLLEDLVSRPEKRLSRLALGRVAGSPESRKKLDFSLFYFASDDRGKASNKYRLLMEGAKFADRHGFAAVWTPERHFHGFGGLYPNPSVTSAAIAAVTERVQIRAGSVVLPLHHPVRVAEEWSVVDNLSNGRIGIAFASGWNQNDFIFAPTQYQSRRDVMASNIEIVRKLWRGEPMIFPGANGGEVKLSIWPRPIQAELPIWLSAFGSPETFRLAGQINAHVLTHLVGQSAEELKRKIKIYRQSRREHGFDPDEGSVVVMLHTFIGEDIDEARGTAREPFLNYLKSSVDLAQILAETTGDNIDITRYSEADVDVYLRMAFDRYCTSSALFGTPESCDAILDRLVEAGVNEIACLIDFGIDVNLVIRSLEHLETVRRRWQEFRGSVEDELQYAAPSLETARERSESRRDLIHRQQLLRRSMKEKAKGAQ